MTQVKMQTKGALKTGGTSARSRGKGPVTVVHTSRQQDQKKRPDMVPTEAGHKLSLEFTGRV